MRLLRYDNDGNIILTKFDESDIPEYAILSHTWAQDNSKEVTYAEVINGTGQEKEGFKKIRFCGEQASRDGLQYFWVDTCCIDKDNGAELSHSINSMFRWYRRAFKCYVYLSDVSTSKQEASDQLSEHTWELGFRKSRWFTRGWTLQELLAPTSVEFFSREGKRLGNKKTLETRIYDLTNIPASVLQGKSLSQISIDERMRWIEHRETGQEEDKAYSLLGIFGVTMFPIYGEGVVKAFDRLWDKLHEMQKCMQDLRLTDPRDDKERIEATKGGLLEDSYRWVIETSDFQQWRTSQHDRLLWIKGDPGKGKTMLLCGIANELQKAAKSVILSYFFCQATDSRINHATAVIRGLIYLLADQQPSLTSHVQKSYNEAGKALFEDANSWVAVTKIFSSILQDPNLDDIYLIVDALDECVVDLPTLLDFIAQSSSVSARVKWVVSSRNIPEIGKRLNTATQKQSLSLELNADSVSAAVATFIQTKVYELATRNKYTSQTRDAVQQHLSLNADGTFLWVALVCQELSNLPGWKAVKKLKAFPSGLDALYQRMLDQIMKSEDFKLCISILAVVSTVYRPITIDELVTLVELPDGVDGEHEEALVEIVGYCRSFLTLRERTIFFVHQSAKDFLVGKASKDPSLFQKQDVHYIIFSRSLQAMLQTLKLDIYSLAAPGISLDQVKPPCPDPLATIRYPCLYWANHLLECDGGRVMKEIKDGGSVHLFLCQSFLYWLEALSLMRNLSECIGMIRQLKKRVQVSFCVVSAMLTERPS
jgi:hypothetical protein